MKRFSVSRSKLAPTERKLRGGYYTPTALADYLCGWAVRSPNDHVLEPSCGDGSFIRALAPRLSDRGRIAAVELVAEELAAARRSVENSGVSADWRCGSFFDFAPEYLRQPPFDAVVGNPPFIRFQHFDKEARDRAFQLLRPFGYHPNGLANAWAAFVQLAAEMLRDGGRLAMVLPAELMQVQYAAELRFRLPHLFEDVSIVTFGELVFPEIQQEVVLLLAEGRRRSGKAAGRLHAHQVRNGDALLDQGPLARLTPELPERYTHEQMKWTALFLDRSEFQVLDACLSHQEFGRLGSWVDVDVGIVTGRNSFFVVDRDEALKLGVDGHVLDVVGRTSALKSIRFTQDDLHGYGKTHPSKLLSLAGLQRSQFSEPLNEYILAGEAQGVHAGYKCRIRNRWFDVPSVYVPDGFMHRQVHHAPLLVANQAAATATDTIHRVRRRPGADLDMERLGAAMVNSVTFACSEVIGRSYGGGVLELEPREAEKLPVPLAHAGKLDVDYLDQMLRAGEIQSALQYGDQVLLKEGCGLGKAEVKKSNMAWQRLRSRRQGRRRAAPGP